MSGSIYLGQKQDIRVAGMSPRSHFLNAQVLLVVLDTELETRVAGTPACFLQEKVSCVVPK